MASTNNDEAPLTSLGVVGNADQDHHPQLPTQQPTPPDEATPTTQLHPFRGSPTAGVPQINPPQILSEAERLSSDTVYIFDDDVHDDDPNALPVPRGSADDCFEACNPASEQPQNYSDSDFGAKIEKLLTELLRERRKCSMDSQVPVDYLHFEVKQTLAVPTCSPAFDPELRAALRGEFGELSHLAHEEHAPQSFIDKLKSFPYIQLDSTGRLAQLHGTKWMEWMQSRWKDLVHLNDKFRDEIKYGFTKLDCPVGAPFEQFFHLIYTNLKSENTSLLKNECNAADEWSTDQLLFLSVPERERVFFALQQFDKREPNEANWTESCGEQWLNVKRAPDCVQPFNEPAVIFNNGKIECPHRQSRKLGKWVRQIFTYLRDCHHIILKGRFTIFLVPEAWLPNGKGLTKSDNNEVVWVALHNSLKDDELFWVLAHELGHVAFTTTTGYLRIQNADVPLKKEEENEEAEGFAELVAWLCFEAFKRHWLPGDATELRSPFGQFVQGFEVVFKEYQDSFISAYGRLANLSMLLEGVNDVFGSDDQNMDGINSDYE